MLRKIFVCVAGLSLASGVALAGPLNTEVQDGGGAAHFMKDQNSIDMADPMPEPPVVPEGLASTIPGTQTQRDASMRVNPASGGAMPQVRGSGPMMSMPERTGREIQKLIRRLG
jgi:hypothetical protein